jgi:hypothetical protein
MFSCVVFTHQTTMELSFIEINGLQYIGYIESVLIKE